MSWNYRIIFHPEVIRTTGTKNTPVTLSAYYGIHEVYYNSEGEPKSYSAEPEVAGESVKELEEMLKMMNKSFKEEVLDVNLFKK